MILSNVPRILRDYSKIFLADTSPKSEMYDLEYAERMRAFSARPLWQNEALFALDGISFPATARALDVGSNNGRGTEFLSQILGVPFDGVDASEAGIQAARAAYPDKAELFHHYDGNILPFGDNEFDLVCSMHVIGHVLSPYSFLHEINRVLKPGGLLRLITPDANYKLFALVDSVLNNYLPDPTVRKYFFKNSLVKMVQESGFVEVSCSTFGERPLLLRALPESDFGRIRIVIKARKH